MPPVRLPDAIGTLGEWWPIFETRGEMKRIMKPETKNPGQESVWDYPRPPRLEVTNKRIRVLFNDVVIAETTRAIRILETSHPPTYYIPPEDVRLEYLVPTNMQTICEFKGMASYWSVRVGKTMTPNAAWSYPNPVPEYADLADYVAFYPARVSACYVDDERVKPQPGGFYGGWITSDIKGPFKGQGGLVYMGDSR